MAAHFLLETGVDNLLLENGDFLRLEETFFDDIRQDIINGLVSAQSETFGWNNERSNIPVTAVVRTSDTVCTITLPALSAYDITAEEDITDTIPASALQGGSAIVASPLVVVTAGAAVRVPYQPQYGLAPVMAQ